MYSEIAIYLNDDTALAEKITIDLEVRELDKRIIAMVKKIIDECGVCENDFKRLLAKIYNLDSYDMLVEIIV